MEMNDIFRRSSDGMPRPTPNMNHKTHKTSYVYIVCFICVILTIVLIINTVQFRNKVRKDSEKITNFLEKFTISNQNDIVTYEKEIASLKNKDASLEKEIASLMRINTIFS